MARPIPSLDLRDVSRVPDKTRSEHWSIFDEAVKTIGKNRSSKDLVLGTLSGWVAGVSLTKIGKVAAFGFGGSIILLHFASEWGYIHVNWDRIKESASRSPRLVETVVGFVKNNSCFSFGFAARQLAHSSVPAAETPEPTFPPALASTLPPALVPTLTPALPPTLAPNLTPTLPSIMPPTLALTPPTIPDTFKPSDDSMFEKTFMPSRPIPHSPKISPSSIPNPNPSVTTTKHVEAGYPNYGGYLYSIPGYSAFQPVNYQNVSQNQAPSTETLDFAPISKAEEAVEETKLENSVETKEDKQTDFEEQFTPKIIPPVPAPDIINHSESKMCITSLSQGSGATVTISSQTPDTKKKPSERFSLKTSIPISKIDMKCVSNPPDLSFQKKSIIYQNKPDATKIEIQSNIVIKSASKEENTSDNKTTPVTNNNINTLLNAAEAINKNDNTFWRSNSKPEPPNEMKDLPLTIAPNPPKPIYNPMNLETKANLANKSENTYNEQKNQIVFIQNKNPSNSKMLLTIQQQNPQVLLQRTNFDPKNLQAPSRLSSQSKKVKEDVVNDNSASKVVALKRMHQENCDENDFENLITENQIYGNKIVVKEKSQGTSQEQDLKNKHDKPTQAEAKNVIIQPNIVYLSNVQFPNLMMIKNNTKVNSIITENKSNKNLNEKKILTDTSAINVETCGINKTKTQNTQTLSADIQVLKSTNKIQTLSTKNKPDLVLQTNQVIMNPQIVYQVPMIVDSDNKLNQSFVNTREYSKLVQKEFPKQFEQAKSEKLFIACPYQMDSKLQPKIVITNIRPKLKVEEFSSLDMYEKRKRIRRLKYLMNQDVKENLKNDIKKSPDKVYGTKHVITADDMRKEVLKEFVDQKLDNHEESSESDSDYEEEELKEYTTIIEKYSKKENEDDKVEFLETFKLVTHKVYKERELDQQERTLMRDAVASAYISAGRIDKLLPKTKECNAEMLQDITIQEKCVLHESKITIRKKQSFFAHLRLTHVAKNTKEEYERIWKEILRERKRRWIDSDSMLSKKRKNEIESIHLDPGGQLQLLTEIKRSVNENNNLIKKRMDSIYDNSDGDSIHTLAEKNFSELNRLSKMAENSVKMISGTSNDTKKRDLNPGFDSENIQNLPLNMKQPFHNYPQIIIPSVASIISLKSAQEPTTDNSTPATSMDEPQNCAAGVEIFDESTGSDKVRDFSCQVDNPFPWPEIETIIKSYKEYDAVRKREVLSLQRRATALRVAAARATRGAACAADCARALLAERRALAAEEAAARCAIQRLLDAVRDIKNS